MRTEDTIITRCDHSPRGENVRKILVGVVVMAVAVLLVSQSAPAQSVASLKQQLQTATFHAGELAQRGAIAATQTHLQHVVNCLVGPQGTQFNSAPGYPCQGQGNGIIPDLQAAADAGVGGAGKALRFANLSLTLALQAQRMADVNEAQPWALVISRQLKIASDSL